MTETATPRKRVDKRHRLELRLSPGEYRLLESAARAGFRSPAAQARLFIVRGLRAQRHREED